MKKKELILVLKISVTVLQKRTLRPYLMITYAVNTVGYVIFFN